MWHKSSLSGSVPLNNWQRIEGCFVVTSPGRMVTVVTISQIKSGRVGVRTLTLALAEVAQAGGARQVMSDET